LRDAALVGLFASAAVGSRPQLVVAVAPMLALVAWLDRRPRAAAVAAAAFALITVTWLVPLVRATGGWNGFLGYEGQQAASFLATDAGATRCHRSGSSIFAHFAIDPWGPRPLGIAVLLLGVWGLGKLLRARRREALPLV